MYHPDLSLALHAAVERLHDDLFSTVPTIAEVAWPWLESLAGGRDVERYFASDWGYPLLSLPFSVERALASSIDPNFRADWLYSTVNGYFYVRLVDDWMDGDGALQAHLLPSTAFFLTRFQSMYQKYFPAGHPFWRDFEREWLLGQDAGLSDARLAQMDETTFEQISSTKMRAGKIPVDAVCHFYGKPEHIEIWSQFADQMGKYVQMVDDIFDWQKDFQQCRQVSYLHSEAERRKRKGESRVAWLHREGLDWGFSLSFSWLAELESRAKVLGVGEVVEMLSERRQVLQRRSQALRAGVSQLAALDRFFVA